MSSAHTIVQIIERVLPTHTASSTRLEKAHLDLEMDLQKYNMKLASESNRKVQSAVAGTEDC